MATKKPEPQREFTISASAIKWTAGVGASLLAALVAWFTVWERIDTHWRQESVQKAQDQKIEAQVKAVGDKAATDLEIHKTAEARRSAWTLWFIQDFRAAAERKWAEDCIGAKKPSDVCREYQHRADATAREADSLKSVAKEASKEKP